MRGRGQWTGKGPPPEIRPPLPLDRPGVVGWVGPWAETWGPRGAAEGPQGQSPWQPARGPVQATAAAWVPARGLVGPEPQAGLALFGQNRLDLLAGAPAAEICGSQGLAGQVLSQVDQPAADPGAGRAGAGLTAAALQVDHAAGRPAGAADLAPQPAGESLESAGHGHTWRAPHSETWLTTTPSVSVGWPPPNPGRQSSGNTRTIAE